MHRLLITLVVSLIPLVSLAADPPQFIRSAVDSEHRSPENRARDAYRHPAQTLAFFWSSSRHDRGRDVARQKGGIQRFSPPRCMATDACMPRSTTPIPSRDTSAATTVHS